MPLLELALQNLRSESTTSYWCCLVILQESLDLVETGVIDPAASFPRLIQLSDTIAAADCFITRCGIDASPSHLGAQYDHMFSEPGVLVGEEQRLAYRAEILIWIDGKIAPLQRPDLLARVVRSSKMKA